MSVNGPSKTEVRQAGSHRLPYRPPTTPLPSTLSCTHGAFRSWAQPRTAGLPEPEGWVEPGLAQSQSFGPGFQGLLQTLLLSLAQGAWPGQSHDYPVEGGEATGNVIPSSWTVFAPARSPALPLQPLLSTWRPCFPPSFFSCLLPFPHSLMLLPFSFSFPLPSAPAPPHAIDPCSSPSPESSPILQHPQTLSLFSVRCEAGVAAQTSRSCAAVGVGPGLHRQAALNDKRGY